MREETLRLADRGMLAMLAATVGVFAIIGTVWLASAADNSRDPTLEPLKAFAYMRQLAGSGAIACGQVAARTDPRPAMECAARAAQGRQAFWVAKEHVPDPRGIHMAPMDGSGHRWWHGLVRSPRGQYYFVIYNHDARGGWDDVRHPAIWTQYCRDPQIEAEGWRCAW